MNARRHVHPFPARMAPDIALAELASLPQGSTVVDPMMGSGTVVRVASELGLVGRGFDVDPLAVLISRVESSSVDIDSCLRVAADVLRRARNMWPQDVSLPWLDADHESLSFVEYWFAPRQTGQLRCLSGCIVDVEDEDIRAFFQVCLSRIIVTKDRGASRARDTSHSRPHRYYWDCEYDVYAAFSRSTRQAASILSDIQSRRVGSAIATMGDARYLSGVADSSADCVITSPPYSDAIDYLRGHRLSLVWLGHTVASLRGMRTASLGFRRSDSPEDLSTTPLSQAARSLPGTEVRRLATFVGDLRQVVAEVARILRPSARACFVTGNTVTAGVQIHNDELLEFLATRHGLRLVKRADRPLIARHRYLPPPETATEARLGQRMVSEVVMTFQA